MTIWSGEEVAEHIETPPNIDVEPNGVELEIDKIYRIPKDGVVIVDDDTRIVAPSKVEVSDSLLKDDNETPYYRIPNGIYEVRLANKIHIPEDVVGKVHPRSTLNRFGMAIHPTAVWDSGYEGFGTLTVDVKVHNLVMGEHEKWFQMMFMDAESSSQYDGHWQNEGDD